MKLIITLTLLALSHARVIEPWCNHVVPINDITFEKQVLKENVDYPFEMVIDYNTNTLFFSYRVDKKSRMYTSASLDLNTNEFRNISGIAEGIGAVVDGKTHKVYLCARNGIYEYDYATHSANHVINGNNVIQMFVKDKLYYTTFPEAKAYTVEGGNSVLIPELKNTKVLFFALDNNNNMYFYNTSGLFYYNKLDREIIELGKYDLNSFSIDINGNLYFSTALGFYKIHSDQTVQKLVEFVLGSGMVVDGDNNFIIGTAGGKIIRLKPTENLCAKPSQNV